MLQPGKPDLEEYKDPKDAEIQRLKGLCEKLDRENEQLKARNRELQKVTAYDPEFHTMHCKEWTTKDLAYLCFYYEDQRNADLAKRFKRTPAAIQKKVYDLKQKGSFDHYWNMGKEMYGDGQ